MADAMESPFTKALMADPAPLGLAGSLLPLSCSASPMLG